MEYNNINIVNYEEIIDSNHPIILDYDFSKRCPRGGSLKLDFFSYGKMQTRLRSVKLNKAVFYKHSPMLFENGVFLLDFKNIVDNGGKQMIKVVRDLNAELIYIENSAFYPIEPIKNALSNQNIKLVNFFNR